MLNGNDAAHTKALGNACWGGNKTRVECNGPNSRQNMADMYYGKGLSSKELYEEIYETCKWPDTDAACNQLLEKQSQQVGPHNIYNIYDNCANAKTFLEEHGLNMFQLQSALHHEMDTGIPATTTLAEQTGKPELVGAVNPTGGYPWACGGNDATRAYLNRSDVMKALHLQPVKITPFATT